MSHSNRARYYYDNWLAYVACMNAARINNVLKHASGETTT